MFSIYLFKSITVFDFNVFNISNCVFPTAPLDTSDKISNILIGEITMLLFGFFCNNLLNISNWNSKNGGNEIIIGRNIIIKR